MRWAEPVARTRERIGVYRVSVGGKPKGKRSLGRTRRRWGGYEDGSSRSGVSGYGLNRDGPKGRKSWGALVTAVMNIRVP